MSEKRRLWIAIRLRRIAQRLSPIKGGWNGDVFTGCDNGDASVWIESDGTSWGTSLKINGKPAMNCTGISFEIKAGDVARATIDLEPVPLLLTGQLRVSDDPVHTQPLGGVT